MDESKSITFWLSPSKANMHLLAISCSPSFSRFWKLTRLKQTEKSMFEQKIQFSVSLIWVHYNLIFLCANFRACFHLGKKIKTSCALCFMTEFMFNMAACIAFVFLKSDTQWNKLKKVCLNKKAHYHLVWFAENWVLELYRNIKMKLVFI
jgi:hypothetical protein